MALERKQIEELATWIVDTNQDAAPAAEMLFDDFERLTIGDESRLDYIGGIFRCACCKFWRGHSEVNPDNFEVCEKCPRTHVAT